MNAYEFCGLDKETDKLVFYYPAFHQTYYVKNRNLNYTKVKDEHFVIIDKTSKSPHRNNLNYKIGDIIYINSPDRESYNYEGITIRKATQYEYDKAEYTNYKNISSNAKIFKYFISIS